MGFRHDENPYKPVKNEDFCEAQNPKCELRPALLSDPDGAGITPPLDLDPLSSAWAPPDHQKSIRFFTISHMADSPCRDPYKTCRLLILLELFLHLGFKIMKKQ